MKKFYSVILLFSFMIGVIQPIIPMIEYHMNDGDFINLIFSYKTPVEIICDKQECQADFLLHCKCDGNCAENDYKELLDLDYYPVPVKITPHPALAILPQHSQLYDFLSEDLAFQVSNINSPPPKLF